MKTPKQILKPFTSPKDERIPLRDVFHKDGIYAATDSFTLAEIVMPETSEEPSLNAETFPKYEQAIPSNKLGSAMSIDLNPKFLLKIARFLAEMKGGLSPFGITMEIHGPEAPIVFTGEKDGKKFRCVLMPIRK